MALLFSGTLGFLVGYLADLGPASRIRWLRVLLWSSSFCLIAASHVLVGLDSPKYSLPSWAVAAGWSLTPPVVALLVYSLFFELSPVATYLGPHAPRQLRTTGSYALVRHPVALWYLLLLGAMLLISRSRALLICAPAWATLELGWALLQDKVILPRTFPNYANYRENTPFLIPKPGSIMSRVKTMFGPHVHRGPTEVDHVSGH